MYARIPYRERTTLSARAGRQCSRFPRRGEHAARILDTYRCPPFVRLHRAAVLVSAAVRDRCCGRETSYFNPARQPAQTLKKQKKKKKTPNKKKKKKKKKEKRKRKGTPSETASVRAPSPPPSSNETGEEKKKRKEKKGRKKKRRKKKESEPGSYPFRKNGGARSASNLHKYIPLATPPRAVVFALRFPEVPIPSAWERESLAEHRMQIER